MNLKFQGLLCPLFPSPDLAGLFKNVSPYCSASFFLSLHSSPHPCQAQRSPYPLLCFMYMWENRGGGDIPPRDSHTPTVHTHTHTHTHT